MLFGKKEEINPVRNNISNGAGKKEEAEKGESADPEEIIKKLKECQENLAKLEKERDDYLAGWQRERADFLNHKKEQAEIFESLRKFANENFILDILPILDNIEIAISHLPENLKENEWAKGIFQIKEQFKDILRNLGIEEIKTEGEKFSPQFHEAVEKAESEKEEGTILEEVQKGYKLHDRVIRPARVKVAVKKQIT